MYVEREMNVETGGNFFFILFSLLTDNEAKHKKENFYATKNISEYNNSNLDKEKEIRENLNERLLSMCRRTHFFFYFFLSFI